MTSENYPPPDHRRLVNGWLWCSLPYATFALTVVDSIITETPPYARRWRGKYAWSVAWELKAKGASLMLFPN